MGKICSFFGHADLYGQSNEIAQKLNLSRRTVSRKITELKNKGIIRRVGADKNGYWEIVDNE